MNIRTRVKYKALFGKINNWLMGKCFIMTIGTFGFMLKERGTWAYKFELSHTYNLLFIFPNPQSLSLITFNINSLYLVCIVWLSGENERYSGHELKICSQDLLISTFTLDHIIVICSSVNDGSNEWNLDQSKCISRSRSHY